MIWLVASVLAGLCLDYVFKEPENRFHPLVYFGRLANALEQRLNHGSDKQQKVAGFMALACAILPILVLVFIVYSTLKNNSILLFLFNSIIIYLCIAWQSLIVHAKAILQPLEKGKLAEAREALQMIVSRQTQNSSEPEVIKGCIESLLENGADAIFNALFWFVVAGPCGIILYRLSNTLDAMWGYKNARFYYFGYAAAKLDDVLNFIPARLTALLYASVGHWSKALNCWRTQAKQCKSINAGVVMCAGAGALAIELGGAAVYHGKIEQKPVMGCGKPAAISDIGRAIDLLNRSLVLFVLLLIVFEVVFA